MFAILNSNLSETVLYVVRYDSDQKEQVKSSIKEEKEKEEKGEEEIEREISDIFYYHYNLLLPGVSFGNGIHTTFYTNPIYAAPSLEVHKSPPDMVCYYHFC